METIDTFARYGIGIMLASIPVILIGMLIWDTPHRRYHARLAKEREQRNREWDERQRQWAERWGRR